MNKISIISFGDVLKGDFGAGCYLIEALAQENLANNISLIYLAEEAVKADIWIFKAELAIIVQAINLGLKPGKVLYWDYKNFKQHLPWLEDQVKTIYPLSQALNRIKLINGFPKEIKFIFIQTKQHNCIYISKEVCRAMRLTIKIIKKELQKQNILRANNKIEPIYNLTSLSKEKSWRF
ncbi:hydrogenase maturation protease [Desulfonauticus submarinus]|uniref:Hydrogenase maturation protease n=1 Tax=Desulfonauticus submarinus TaxID=206665 RepID=A0A1H0ETP2_9BACT|nr:hypothetical protein [Desulfonauticus submarinus]SDN85715.1 hydrogenase maturation protease [Desulfonauticus submarinus]